MVEVDDRRAGVKTLQFLAVRGVRFAEADGNKKPIRKGWQTEDIKPLDSEDVYGKGNYLVGLLDKSEVAVIDIDKPDNQHARQILEQADFCGVWKAQSRKGFHLYFAKDDDFLSLLDGRKHQTLKSSTRKNAEPIGDILGNHATAYRRVAGDIKPIATCGNLYSLISHGKEPPSKKAWRIYQDVLTKLTEAQPGERNNAMYKLCCELHRRLSACCADHVARKYLTDLAQEYDRINPEDAGAFGAEKISEIMKNPAPQIADNETTDYVRAAVDSYLALHDNFVLISGDGRSDEDRVVYEWDAVDKQWTDRYLAQIDEDGNESVISSICDMYSMFVEDATGEVPTEAKVAQAESLIYKRLKRMKLKAAPDTLFDAPKDGVCKVLINDKRILSVTAKDKQVAIEAENEPEYYLLNKMGNVEKGESGLWQQFLADIFQQSKELQDFLGRLLASAFVPTSDPIFVICHGAGANGKSVLLSTIASCFGNHAVEVSPSAFAEASQHNDQKRQLDERSIMIGRKVAVCPESNTDPLDMAFIKAMTSGEKVKLGGMFQKSRLARLHCIPMVATNDLPRLRNVSYAVKRRVVLIPFKETFGTDEKPSDPYLNLKLKNELPKIRWWLIEQVHKFVRQQDSELDIPKRLQDLSDKYMENQTNPIESTLADWLDVVPVGKGDIILGRKNGEGKDSFYTGVMALAMWAHSSMNMQSKKPSQKQVRTWLEKRDIISDDRGRMNCTISDKLAELLDGESDAPDRHLLYSSRQRKAQRIEPDELEKDGALQGECL